MNEKKADIEKDDEPEYLEVVPDRGHWSGRFDFLLACLGTAVGLGNVWRFPYLCYNNGGGAFVIPYILMVFLVGMPLFLVELALGQYSALGPLKVFNALAPIFKGLGYAMIIVSVMVAIYYNMIVGWTLFYFFDSFRTDVQWQYCHHDFNTDLCFSDSDYKKCKSGNESNVFSSRTCYNSSYAFDQNITDIPEMQRISAPEEYLNNYMLRKSASFEDYGTIQWPLLVSLFGAWVIVVLSLIKGIKTSGRVVYFTATFPYLILIILFIRGVTLEGAYDGIYFYMVPDWSKLYDVNVWKEAAIQVFYSFSIGGGGMMTYASYNRFRNNLIKDVLIIGISDMLTSLFSGLVVFSMLGFMASQLHKSVPDVVQSGTGLAFIAYPDAISRMPVSVLWSLLFFFMLFLLGIDSQFAVVETIITFVFDQFPGTRARKPLVVICVGIIFFILGLPLCTNGGIYLLEIIDNYATGWPFLVIGLLELFIVAYVYGMERFMCDLKEMTGWSPITWTRSHLIVTVMTISPIVLMVLLVMSFVSYKPLTLGNYVYPFWANAIGWTLSIIPIAFILFGILIQLIVKHRDLNLIQRIRILLKPTSEWTANAVANTSSSDIGPSTLSRNITMSTLNGTLDYSTSNLDVPPPVYNTLSHL